MNDIAEHCEEQENVDERRDHIDWSSVPEKKKRRQVSDIAVQDLVRENPSAAHLEKPKRVIVIPEGDSIRTSTTSAMKDSIRLGCITKGGNRKGRQQEQEHQQKQQMYQFRRPTHWVQLHTLI